MEPLFLCYEQPTTLHRSYRKLAATVEGIQRDLQVRGLTDERDKLAKYAQSLAIQVKAGALDSKKAVDMYFGKAKELTKGTKDATSNALLVATGAALAVRGAVSNNITRPSMGQDTLHHYFFNAYNTHDGVPVLAMSVGSNVVLPTIRQGRPAMEDDPLDVDANNFGAAFGDVLQRSPDTPPSEVMP